MFRPAPLSNLKKTTSIFCLSVLMATTGCTYINKATNAITGDDVRTVPDTGMTPLGARRAPMLNPGGALYNPNADLEMQKISAENPYMNEGMKVAKDKVNESYYATPAPQGQQPGGWSGNVFHGMPAQQSANGRRMPMENETMMQQPPTVMAAPVEPAPVSAPLPPTAYNDVPPAAPQPVSVAAAPQPIPTMGKDGYPNLAATPVNPVVQPGNYQTSMNNLTAERELAENMRREMMQNPNMAEPGVAVAAAAPAPAPAKSDAEFNGWLKNMFSEKDSSNSNLQTASERKAIASAPAYVPPSAPAYVPQAAAEPQMQAAGMEPIVLTPPPGMEQTPPMQMASIAPANTAPALEPITLNPPPEVAGTPGPIVGMGANGAEPIMLNPPAAAQNHNVRFLQDSRYASRRGASRMAMAR